jgi:transglycosylase-like protein
MKKELSEKLAFLKLLFGLYLACLFKIRRLQTHFQTRLCKKLGERSHLDIQTDSLKISVKGGISGRGIRVVYNKNILITISQLEIRPRIFDTLKGRYNIGSVFIDELKLEYGFSSPVPSSPAGGNKRPSSFPPGSKRYYSLAFRVLSGLSRLFPYQTSISKTEIIFQGKTNKYAGQLTNLSLTGGIDGANTLSLKNDRNFELLVGDDRTVIAAGTFSFSLQRRRSSLLNISLALKDFDILSALLSTEKVFVSSFEINLDCNRTKDFFEISETSGIIYNRLPFQIYFRHVFDAERIDLRVSCRNISPGDFLRSFPGFSCKALYDLDCSGVFSLEVNGVHFPGDPGNSFFHLGFIDDQLVVNTTGQDFIVRKIDQVTKNNGFIGLDKIPEVLYKNIINTEDPNFFLHKGIDPKLIGYAILQNLQKRKITRGGSSITMQLARNLYINRKRCLYRKVEEVAITWLLESAYKIPKNNILGIYLNIIEFSPGVYGLENGCQYYFSRKPAELSVTECLVLSYIIPRPKHFEKAFMESSGQLRVNLRKHIEDYSRLLFLNDNISVKDFDEISFTISIRGKTLNL